MLRLILLTPIESGTSTWKSLWSYCLFNCWQVRVIKLIISPWFTTPNKTSALNAEPFKCSAFISVCCQLYCMYYNTISWAYWCSTWLFYGWPILGNMTWAPLQNLCKQNRSVSRHRRSFGKYPSEHSLYLWYKCQFE
jgi:hypothetical protein